MSPALYAYAGARLDEHVLRLHANVGPVVPTADAANEGPEYGVHVNAGLHFDRF